MFYPAVQDEINQRIIEGARMANITLEEIIKIKLHEWRDSEARKTMLLGEQYYRSKSDIQKKKTKNENNSNAKLEHGFIRKLVDQKTGYLFSKPFSIKTENDAYGKLLNELLDENFLRLLKNVCNEAVNKGIAWIQVYFTQDGEIAFKKIPSHEVIPLWADSEHTKLDGLIRTYEIDVYERHGKRTETKVEYYDPSGVKFYVFNDYGLTPDVETETGAESNHFTMKLKDGNEQQYNWMEIPFVPFKYNEEEQPLVEMLKSLVDDYNNQSSINADLLADIPDFVYIIKNYDGEDLAEFLSNLRKYRAVKVTDDGEVDKLSAEPVTDALQAHLAAERKAIYEFGRGVDTQNDDMGNASGVALKFRYADLDLDANTLETEFQASITKLLWFVSRYFLIAGKGDFTKEAAKIVFNRDIIISEAEVIEECRNSTGIISNETIVANHPWVDDPQKEMERLKKEREETENEGKDDYPDTFRPAVGRKAGDGREE